MNCLIFKVTQLLFTVLVFSPFLLLKLTRKFFPEFLCNISPISSPKVLVEKIPSNENCHHGDFDINIFNYLKNSKFNIEETQEENVQNDNSKFKKPNAVKLKQLSIGNADTSGASGGDLNTVEADLNLYNIISNARRNASSTPKTNK
jgi:hypothetical protein